MFLGHDFISVFSRKEKGSWGGVSEMGKLLNVSTRGQIKFLKLKVNASKRHG